MSSGCLPETKNKPTHISGLKGVHGHLRNLRSGQLRESLQRIKRSLREKQNGYLQSGGRL